jgi:hypothetical protein
VVEAPRAKLKRVARSAKKNQSNIIKRALRALMTNSNLVDCSTGRSAGFAPLRILPV